MRRTALPGPSPSDGTTSSVLLIHELSFPTFTWSSSAALHTCTAGLQLFLLIPLTCGFLGGLDLPSHAAACISLNVDKFSGALRTKRMKQGEDRPESPSKERNVNGNLGMLVVPTLAPGFWHACRRSSISPSSCNLIREYFAGVSNSGSERGRRRTT